MNGDIFPKDIVIADEDFACGRGLMAEVLRSGADDGTITDEITVAERDAIRQNRMSLNDAVIAKGHPLFDNGIGADFHIGTQNGLRADKSCRVDVQEISPRAVAECLAV